MRLSGEGHPQKELRTLGGRFGYFSFFSARGGEGGSLRPPGRGGGGAIFKLKIPEGGLPEGRGRGAGRVSAANWGFFGGGGCGGAKRVLFGKNVFFPIV